MVDFDSINLGFSQEAIHYDEEELKNPIIIWLRSVIRNTVKKYIPINNSILEINAGSGLDALWFAEHGYQVHATDIADGMLEALKKKVTSFNKPEQFTFQKLSFNELEKSNYLPFDVVFSNFGGLNCTNDLSIVVQGVKKVLKPNGYVVWVFMPKVCLWESAQVIFGKFQLATRRFKKNGVQANVQGAYVNTYYYSANDVIKALGSDFKLIHLQSLSLFAPPMNSKKFIYKFPSLTKFLIMVDNIAGKLPLLNKCGDFLMLVASYHPQKI